MWDGGGWLQGQVVGGFPRPCTERVQCVCEQLVECALYSSSTRLPQVSVLVKTLILHVFTYCLGMISSRLFVRDPLIHAILKLIESIYSHRRRSYPSCEYGSW